MQSLVVGAIVSLLVILILASIQDNSSSGLRKIPNAHFTVPFSRFWLLVIKWRSCENRTRLDLHRRLGPVVRIGPREVSVNCVEEGIRLVYSGKFARGEWFHRAFGGGDIPPFMFIMLGNDDHKQRRKMLSNVYSKSHVLNSSALDDGIAKVLGRLKKQMADWASSGASVEVLTRAKACIMDVVTGWLYGTPNGTNSLQDQTLREDFLNTIDDSWGGLFWRGEVPWLARILPAIGINVVPKTARIAQQKLGSWSNEMATKASQIHTSKSSPTANVYDHLRENLRGEIADQPTEADNKLIATELYDHLLASYEVAGIALTYAMYELSIHPEQQKALRKEVLILNESSERPLAARMDELPLLDAIITETMRVRSPNPGPWPRVVPPSGCRLAGRYDVPGGTVVSSTSWTLHRNPDLFPNPEEWRPERWLDADEATWHEMKRWFWAFGSGARMCIGNNLAIRILKEVIVAVYSDYETLLDEDLTGNMEQIDAMLAGPVSNRLMLKFRPVK